jgi:hypothetical protein
VPLPAHVKPPTWRRTRDLERSNFRHKRPLASEATLANPAAEGGTKIILRNKQTILRNKRTIILRNKQTVIYYKRQETDKKKIKLF